MMLTLQVAVQLLGSIVLFLGPSDGAAIRFDLQDYLENSDIAAILPRSNATGERTVLLQAGHYAEISFCLPVSTQVSIDDIRYSNDGDSDSVPVFIDQELVGSFESLNHSDWGHNWNKFLSSGAIGEPKTLAPGFHKLQISVNQTDLYGVELDTVELNIDVPDLIDDSYLRCEKCLDRVVPDNVPEDTDEDPGAVLLLQNAGLSTSEDGQTVANVDMFPRPVVPCRVQASAPWYVGGQPGTGGEGETVWQIGNNDGSADEFAQDAPLTNAESFVFSIGTPNSGFSPQFAALATARFQVSFEGSLFPSLFNDTSGLAYIDLGLVPAPFQDVDVSLQTVSETGQLSPPILRKFTDILTSNTWEMPLVTLRPSGENLLEFNLKSQSQETVVIDFIRMYTNPSTPDVPATLDSQQFNIEAIPIEAEGDDNKPSMSIEGIESDPVLGAEALSITVTPNGGSDSVPIFELSQSGVISMASPLLGELAPVDVRSGFRLAPSVSGIKTVKVNPDELSMNITFTDDSVIRLRVDATPETTEFTITGATLNVDTEANPLVRFEAPWSSDASNGADTIVTNGRTVNQLTDGWDTLEASTVDFINRCGTGDGSTGSDWKIELLDP